MRRKRKKQSSSFLFVVFHERLWWNFYAFYPQHIRARVSFLVLGSQHKFIRNSREPAGRTDGGPQYGDNSCLRFTRLFGFYPSSCKIWGPAECGPEGRCYWVGRCGQKSRKCNCNKSPSSCSEGLMHFSCVLQDWRNLSSPSDLVSANKTSGGLKILFGHSYFVFISYNTLVS